jgi:hypothetical protein
MSDFMETVFGPLSSEYCYYFYFLSIFMFFWFMIALIGGFAAGIVQRKGFMFFLAVAGGSLTYLLLYFVNRLMYSVCTKAL